MTGSLPTAVDSSAVVTISVLDGNFNPMADGTTVAISSSGGKVDPSDINFAPLASVFNLVYTTGTQVGVIETLKIIVTSESGSNITAIFSTGVLTP